MQGFTEQFTREILGSSNRKSRKTATVRAIYGRCKANIVILHELMKVKTDGNGQSYGTPWKGIGSCTYCSASVMVAVFFGVRMSEAATHEIGKFSTIIRSEISKMNFVGR